MKDLTVIMMTPNKVPKEWAKYHKKMLLEAIEDTPIITISAEPLDWGINLIQTGYSLTNIYRQMLRGAKLATTPYIAIADDDTLYPKEHFEYRPPPGTFGFNLNRWHLFTWGKAFYFHKPRPGGGLMIAPRELVINAVEARFRDYPDEFPGFLLRELGTRGRAKDYDNGELHEFYSQPVVSFYHQQSIDPLNQRKRKAPWPVQAFDIPVWGRAEDLRKLFK